MTEPFLGRKLRYFMTVPGPCPYLEGREERKVFVHLPPLEAVAVNDHLSKLGFRRSQNIAYRPACIACQACRSVRIPVDEFTPSRTDRRILKKNNDLKRSLREAEATPEQFELLKAYLAIRHPDGGMIDMDWSDMVAMIEDTLVRTHIVEYRLKDRLVAAILVDAMSDGLSLVYCFYDPEMTKRSLGRFVILDHIHQAQQSGYGYVYLGYWVKGSPKMDYKGQFRPLEGLNDDGIWVSLPSKLEA